MPKSSIVKGKHTLFFIIFIIGVIMLLYYISVTQTKIIENYTQTELKQIADKMINADTTSNKKTMDLSALLTMDLSGVIKRLFGSKCLAGCMSPDNMNRNDSMCKTSVKPYGSVLECPWRCNLGEFTKQKKYDIIFNEEIEGSKIKKCSPDTEGIDCGGCVPLRVFS